MMRWRRRVHQQELAHDVVGLGVWVSWRRDLGLWFNGHHLMRGDRSPFGFDAEYEYGVWLTRAETQQLAVLLGVRPSGLVPAIAPRGSEIVKRGEHRWVRDHLGPNAGRVETRLRELDGPGELA